MPLIEELSEALRAFEDGSGWHPQRIYMTPADELALAVEPGARGDAFWASRFLGVPIKIALLPAVQCWLDCAEWRVEVVQDAHTYGWRIGIAGTLATNRVAGNITVNGLTWLAEANLVEAVAVQLHTVVRGYVDPAPFPLPEHPTVRQDFGPGFIAQLIQARAGLQRQPDVLIRAARPVRDPAGRWSAAESWLV